MEDNEFQKAYYGKMSSENQKLAEKLQEARSNLVRLFVFIIIISIFAGAE